MSKLKKQKQKRKCCTVHTEIAKDLKEWANSTRMAAEAPNLVKEKSPQMQPRD
jgi:hypothetical protein